MDTDLFERVQARLRHNLQRSRRNAKQTYLLSRHIRCEKCGYAYHAAHVCTGGKDYYSYRCGAASQSPARHRCGSLSVRMSDADAAAWKYVSRILDNPALIVAEMERQRAAQGTTDVERDLESIAAQLGKLANRERKLLVLALDSEDEESTTLFQRERRAIQEQRDRLRAEQERLEAVVADIITPEAIADVEAYCERVRGNLAAMTIEEKRVALDALNIKIAVTDNGRALFISGSVPTCAVTLQRPSRS